MTSDSKIENLLNILNRGVVKRIQPATATSRYPVVTETSIFTDKEVNKIKDKLLKLANIE